MNEDDIIEFIPNRFAKVYNINRDDKHSIYKKEQVKDKEPTDVTYEYLKNKISTGEISDTKPLYKPGLSKTTLMDAWKLRGKNFKSLEDIPFDQPVILCNWSGLHEVVLNRLENVYQVIDRQTKKIYKQSVKKFMYSTNTTKFDINPVDTYIYHGKNTKHIKLIQKRWVQSTDIRSFKTLDSVYSKELGITETGTASIYTAVIGYIIANNNSAEIFVSGLDLAEVNPSEQILINNNKKIILI